jgi:hypothetical protein
MKRVAVVITPRAAKEIDEAAKEWAERDAPTLIDDALGRAGESVTTGVQEPNAVSAERNTARADEVGDPRAAEEGALRFAPFHGDDAHSSSLLLYHHVAVACRPPARPVVRDEVQTALQQNHEA